MGMPRNLLLVRHGQSEGNIALGATRSGDDSLITHEGFAAQHSSKWRLTAQGRIQARKAGEWIRSEFPDLDFFYTSEFARAMESAALMDIIPQGGYWRLSPYLRERDWGDLDRMTKTQRDLEFAVHLADADTSPFYWRPPNGESFADVSARYKIVLDTLAREWEGRDGIIVAHGELIETASIELERRSETEFLKMKADRSHKIRNCDIHHYTRLDENGTMHPYFVRKRVILDGIPGEFTSIERRKYSNTDLLAMVNLSPAFFGELTETQSSAV